MSNFTILNFQKSTLSKNSIGEKYKRSALSLSIADLTGIETSLLAFIFDFKKEDFLAVKRAKRFRSRKGHGG